MINSVCSLTWEGSLYHIQTACLCTFPIPCQIYQAVNNKEKLNKCVLFPTVKFYYSDH